MSATTTSSGQRVIEVDDYAEYLRDHNGYLKVPFHHIKKLGFVAQTVAALLEFTNKSSCSTFASVPTIANYGCLPVRTMRRHLQTLAGMNKLRNLGRETPDGGKQARRTCTIAVSKGLWVDVKSVRDGGTGKWTYVELPRWAAKCIPAWTDRFVYATILSRRLSIERWEANAGCAEERLALSAEEVARLIGRPQRCIWRSFERLQARGLIRREGFMFHGDRCVLTLPKHMAQAILPADWIPSDGE